ncbi:MAG: sigma-70 family RNA polymerase sigma factor [Dysgonomonas sp.]
MISDKSENQDVSEIFNKYKFPLHRYISKHVPLKEDVEDILQNVFYQLTRADRLENPIDQVSSWLYSVARNQIIDRSRKHKDERMPVVTDRKNDDSFLGEITEILLSDTDSSPELDYFRSMIWEELDVALGELPIEQKEAFELTEIEGLSFKEIAEMTGITVNTLISRKRYAVLYLRERLKYLYDELLSD